MLFIADSLVIAGVCFLGISLFPIKRLVGQLPPGSLRQKWNILRALILFFMAGYIGYIFADLDGCNNYFDLVVPAVFFWGAVFVLLVGTLALQTAKDIRRITNLEHESITDPLIGINNRRRFDRVLTEEIARANRYGIPLSMLLLDIDHFKKVNDTYGHYVGDLVLKRLGKLIKNVVRQTDIVARYGGEEISIILPHTRIKTAGELAERLRREVEKTTMVSADEHEGNEAVSITVSIGGAGLTKGISESHVLIKKTDEALYKAKQAGRNRVVIEDDLN